MKLTATFGIMAIALSLNLSAGEPQKNVEAVDGGTTPASQAAQPTQVSEYIDSILPTAATETGCCQHGETACAGDVTKSQCDQMNGKFHSGEMCRTDTGKCTSK